MLDRKEIVFLEKLKYFYLPTYYSVFEFNALPSYSV